jgi:hypothetical protein
VNVANDRDAQNFDSKPFDLIRKDNSPEASGAVQISEIYRNIVKMVHPDLEQDPAIQQKKSEWMKLITVAYEKRDLSALIQLELQIQNDLGIQLETPSDKKINDYNEALRGILEDKELDTFMLYNNPRYYPLHFYFEPFGGLDAINFSKHALVSDMNDQMNSDQKVLARLTKNKKSRER